MTSHNKLGRINTDDTYTRLRRLGHAATGHSLAPIIKRSRLIEESEQALQSAAKSGLPQQQVVAGRILECSATYHLWETQHLRLMDRISDASRHGRQAAAALSVTFSLVYAKSLFEYLRASGASKPRRRKLIAHFHGDNGYVKTLIAEHGNYLRSVASLICIQQIGLKVIGHRAFGEPLDDYQRIYAEYFDSYCQWTVPVKADEDREVMNALQQELKLGVLAARQRLLAMPVRMRVKAKPLRAPA